MTSIENNPFPPETSQAEAWQIVGPEAVGWILQIFISGVCLQKAAPLFIKDCTLNWFMKTALTTVLVLNTITLFSTVAELLIWSTNQRRDEDSFFSYKAPDAYQPILAGSIAVVVQCFFAHRAWKVCNRSILFPIPMGICILASFIGAIGLGIVQIQNMHGSGAYYLFLIFTELWTWGAVIADLAISLVIILGLLSKKTGYDMPSDGLVMQIIGTAMHSASLTTVFATSAAIIYAIDWNNDGASISLAFIYALPSLYTYSLLWCLDCTNDVRRKQKDLASRSAMAFSIGQLTGSVDIGAGGSVWGSNVLDADFSDVVKSESFA